MGDRSAHDVGSKAPEDEASVAQETEEAGGTEVQEGFETSRRRVGEGGPNRMYFFLCFVRSLLLFFLVDMGRRRRWDTPSMTLVPSGGRKWVYL